MSDGLRRSINGRAVRGLAGQGAANLRVRALARPLSAHSVHDNGCPAAAKTFKGEIIVAKDLMVL